MENEVHTVILPRTEDLVNWCAWLVPVIFSLLWDVWKAWKRRALWIPAQALVLSALIIQLLSFIDYSHISVYSGSGYQTKEVVAVLVKNQLVIDSGRLMMCVLIAYLLPGMARSGSTTVGIDIAALVLSIIFNILSEVHSVWKVEKRNESMSAPAADYNVETKGSDRKWSKVCSTTLFIATIYLLWLLIQAAMIGRSIRRIMSQKITSALSCCCTPCDRPRCNETKDHVLKCWMVARVSQPDYVLVRSDLCGMAWAFVTVCIVVSVIKWRYVQLTNYELLNSGNKRTLTQFVIVGQFVIVLIGWIVVSIRAVNSYYIFGNISHIVYFQSMTFEDVANVLETYLIRLLVRDKRIQEKIIRDLRKKRHVLNPKHRLQIVCVWWLQKLRVSDPEHWLQKLLLLHREHWLQKLTAQLSQQVVMVLRFSKLVYDNGQFSKYKESLEMFLFPGQSAQILWVANQWGFRKVERYMDQGQEDGKRSSSELICLLRLETGTAEGEAGKSAKEVKAHLKEANKNSWKRTAVSLIHFMIYSYNDSDASAIEDASVIEKVMQCYIQGREYMNFVYGLNEEVKSLGRQADIEFDSLQHSWNKRVQLDSEIKQPLDQLKSCSDEERRNLQNSRDSREVAKYCLLETWTVIDPCLSAAQINKIHVLANFYFVYMTGKAHLQQANKNSWKRTAVSLIHFMIDFYDPSDDSTVIEKAMQCYIQGWEYMNFVDGLNEEVKSLGRQADAEFDSLQHTWNKLAQRGMPDTEIKQPLGQLRRQLESLSNEERLNLQNSSDSTEVAIYCLFKTWTVIDPYLSASETSTGIHPCLSAPHLLQRVLANVYFVYMTEDLNKAVLQKCSKLAEEGMEEEILHVAFLSAKAQEVLDKVGEGNNPRELAHNTDQGSTSSPITTVNERVGEGNDPRELPHNTDQVGEGNDLPNNTDQGSISSPSENEIELAHIVVDGNDPKDPVELPHNTHSN